MKLYLSSYRIPTPDDLARLIGKNFADTKAALIPNAQDYYAGRARAFKINNLVVAYETLGMNVDIVDLRDFDSAEKLKSALASYDLLWAMGGNTFCLRYEMRRSGFDNAILDLLKKGVVFAGDSAGALVAGTSIGGIETADEPAYAEQVIKEGLNLVPYVILPHVDNPEFSEAVRMVKSSNQAKVGLIELEDSQAVLFNDGRHWLTESSAKRV